MPKKILKKFSREVLRKIVRDSAPDLAEMLIKEYLKGSSNSTILFENGTQLSQVPSQAGQRIVLNTP